MQAQMAAKSYRVRIDSIYGIEKRSRLVEFVSPDRFRIVTDQDEMIIIGQSTFRRKKGEVWQRFPFDVGSMIARFRDPKLIEDMGKRATVIFLGQESLEGQPMWVFEYGQINVLGTNLTTRSKVWVSVKDGLPRRMEVDGEISGTRTKDINTNYDYGAEIRIEPPMFL